MMKRVCGGLVAGAVLLGGMAAAQGAVQLAPAEEEIAAMESAFDQVSLFFSGLITELKGAVATLNAVDADFAAKYRVVAAQLRDSAAKIQELQEICAQLPGLRAEVDGLATRLDEAWMQISALRGLTESLARTDQELAAGIASLVEDLERTRQEFATAIATLGDKVSDLTEQGTVHANRLTAVEGAVLALKSQIEACEASLKAEIEGCEARLSQEIVSLQGSIAGIKGQLAEYAGRIAALESQDIGSMQRRILALEQAVQALNIKIENNREKISYLERAIGGFTSDLKTTIGALQSSVDDHETRLAAVETTVTGLDVKALQDGLAMAQGLAIVALLAGLAALVLGLLGG